MISSNTFTPSLVILLHLGGISYAAGFVKPTLPYSQSLHPCLNVQVNGMKRPLLDQVARTVFNLEKRRVEESLVKDEKGRLGEPMEWSEGDSLANKFSEVMASGPGYAFKQFVADLTAGDYNETKTRAKIDDFISANRVAMFSFTSCPFCQCAKDYLNEAKIEYGVIELDELEGNEGNKIRASLGKMTKRTSVPSIFIDKKCIGGCNDGPGLLPLAKSGELDRLLSTN